MRLSPKCLRSVQDSRKPAAYTADGFMLPCCWLDGPEYEDRVKELGLRDESLNVSTNNIYDIITSDRWTSFFNMLINNPSEAPEACWQKCSVKDSDYDTIPLIQIDDYPERSQWDQVNLDISYRCMLRCPQCIRQTKASQQMISRSSDISQGNLHKVLDHFKLNIVLCGQISDPIDHPNFFDVLNTIVDRERFVAISTAGSNKTHEFWDEAFKIGLGRVHWIFGVDGIDRKSEIYRVGSNFENVWQAMIKGRSMGHLITWQYIIFGFNEDDVAEAQLIAHEQDFNLLLIKTDRGFRRTNLRKNVSAQGLQPSLENRSSDIKEEKELVQTKDIKRFRARKKERKSTLINGENK